MPAERVYVANVPSQLMTAEELLRANLSDQRAELIRGYLVVREIARLIGNHVHDHDLGVVYGAETGVTLARQPDTVRAPDVAFVHTGRLPSPEPVAFPDLAPDLVVEVLSPGDRPGDTLAKVADWLSAGTRLVWVIDSERRLARLYRADGTESVIADGGALEGEDVLPGFSCSLSAIL